MSPQIKKRNDCRACGRRDLELYLSLKPTPIGDAFLAPEKKNQNQKIFPIDLYLCNSCGLAQLTNVIRPDVLCGDFIEIDPKSLKLTDHFQKYANDLISSGQFQSNDLVVNICSNDRHRGGFRCGNDETFLKPFLANGQRILGIEPAPHIAKESTRLGVLTLDEFFTERLANKIVKKYGRAKLVTANNVFANVDNVLEWVKALDTLMDQNGLFVFESYYLADLVKNMVFDLIYHEHLNSFSVRPIKFLFENAGMELVKVQKVDTKGGSLRYFVQRLNGPLISDGSVARMIEEENEFGLYRKDIYLKMEENILNLKNQLRGFLSEAKKEGKKIAAFGASISCTTLMYHFEIGEFIDYLIDDNNAKQGLFSPGYHLKVLSSSEAFDNNPDYIVILAWRFAEGIIANYKEYFGGKFLVPVPAFQISESN